MGFKRESVKVFKHPDAKGPTREWALCDVDEHGVRRWAYRYVLVLAQEDK